MSSGGSAPAAPDYSPVINSLSGLMNQSSGWATQEMPQWQGQFNTDKSVTYPIVGQQSNTAANQTQFGEGVQNNYTQNGQTALNDYTSAAENYASPTQISANMGTAEATAAQAGDAAIANNNAQLQSYGINPASGRLAGTNAALQMQKAAAVAGAGNTARQATINTGLGLQSDAVSKQESAAAGIGEPAVNAGTSAGSQAVTNQLATTSSGASTIGTAPTYLSAATGAGNATTNAMNAQYSNQLAQYNANQQSMMNGAALGVTALGMFFDDGGEVPDTPQSKRQGIDIDGTGGGSLRANLSPSRGVNVDDIPAQAGNSPVRLNAGEFVMPDYATQYWGKKHLTGMIEKAQKATGQQGRRIGVQRRALEDV
jgi:hypothetical protein